MVSTFPKLRPEVVKRVRVEAWEGGKLGACCPPIPIHTSPPLMTHTHTNLLSYLLFFFILLPPKPLPLSAICSPPSH